jgi:hypothetical protein
VFFKGSHVLSLDARRRFEISRFVTMDCWFRLLEAALRPLFGLTGNSRQMCFNT